MEVDMYSPSFRSMRSCSTKRARSPEDSPSPLERHSKRATVNRIPTIHPQSSSSSNVSVHSSGTPRHPSEDWVQQTGGLTIDSPLLPSGTFQDMQGTDESMTVDAEESHGTPGSNENNPLIGFTTRAHHSRTHHGPFIRVTTSSQYPQDQSQHHHEPPFIPEPHQPLCLSQDGLLLQPGPPTINIHPATPSASPIGRFHSSHHAQTPPPSPSTSRKQRFTMGPRADCEKCKLGVKGHWMHFD